MLTTSSWRLFITTQADGWRKVMAAAATTMAHPDTLHYMYSFGVINTDKDEALNATTDIISHDPSIEADVIFEG